MKYLSQLIAQLNSVDATNEQTLNQTIYCAFKEIVFLKVSRFNFAPVFDKHDVVHDIFVKLFTFPQKTWRDKKDHLIPFVSRVINNHCLDTIKKVSRRRTGAIDDTLLGRGEAPLFEARLAINDLLSGIIDGLPAQQKRVIRLYMQGLSFEDIAREKLKGRTYNMADLKRETKNARDYKSRAFRQMKSKLSKA